MRRRDTGYNPKRKILPNERVGREICARLGADASYGGNPEHKANPADYGLTPPCNPRPGKTLCDAERVFLREEALSLLQQGFERGLVSVQMRDGWPQNVWAVSAGGQVFEAQLENPATGTYHGYPMPEGDDFRTKVVDEWSNREPRTLHRD